MKPLSLLVLALCAGPAWAEIVSASLDGSVDSLDLTAAGETDWAVFGHGGLQQAAVRMRHSAQGLVASPRGGSQATGSLEAADSKKGGSYTVKLTLTDDQGLTATASTTIVTIGPGTGAGTILCERWKGIPGTSVADLKTHAHFADKPDDATMLKAFDIPENWADNYGTRLRGFLHPPATGDYTFYIASDDSSEFLLSTDESPANAKVVCRMNGSTGRYHWTDAKDRKSEPIRLEAGKRYYVEALHKDGTGGDHSSVGWECPGIGLAAIDGQYLSPPAR